MIHTTALMKLTLFEKCLPLPPPPQSHSLFHIKALPFGSSIGSEQDVEKVWGSHLPWITAMSCHRASLLASNTTTMSDSRHWLV